MKTSLLGLLLPLSGAIAFACTPASENTNIEEGALTGAELDDTIATTVLAGGCQVSIGGSSSTTKGSGGSCPTTLSAIMDVLEGKGASGAKTDKPRVFVVSEEGDHPKESPTYRFVIGSKVGDKPLWVATVGGAKLGEGSAEAIGWSPALQAFAYYKVEGGRWVRKGDGTQIKSNTRGKDRPFECATCHSSGAPLMKELHDSWGNWDSTWFSMPKPDGANALFNRLFDNKTIADDLEPEIIDGIHLHSKGRVERAIKENALGGVLTQLMCEVGEPSLIGAHFKSSQRMGKVDSFSSMLPTSLLLNPLWSPPGTGTGEELGLEQNLGVKTGIEAAGDSIDPDTYAKAIVDNRQTIGGKSGDAMFPMSAPQAGYADLDAVQELLRRKLVDKDIVADVLMTDFTVSSYSKVRCDLASTIPATWSSPEELRQSWAQNLAASNLRGAKGLKARLENPNDLKSHERTISTYSAACAKRDKPAMTIDALKIISQRRAEFTARYGDVGQGIVESEWLIPKDGLGSRPGALRLSATTCAVEPSSNPFVGENDAPAPSVGTDPITTGPIPAARLADGARFEVLAANLNCRAGAGTLQAIEQKLVQGDQLTATQTADRPRLATAPDGKPWVLVQGPTGGPCYVSAQFQFLLPR